MNVTTLALPLVHLTLEGFDVALALQCLSLLCSAGALMLSWLVYKLHRDQVA